MKERCGEAVCVSGWNRSSLLAVHRLDGNRDPAADCKLRRHLAPSRRQCLHKIIENDVRKMLLENSFVAI